jgi:hypothetical protein
MGEVVRWNGITRLDLPPQQVLDGASEAQLSGVVVLGYDAEGNDFYASSYADGGDVLWLLEKCKKRLLEMGDE